MSCPPSLKPWWQSIRQFLPTRLLLMLRLHHFKKRPQPRRSTMRLLMLLVGFDLLFSGCGINRPDTNICIVNAPAKNRKCYNLLRDYDDTGALKKGAVPQYRANLTIDDLNKALIIDPVVPANNQGIANLNAWIQD